MSDWSSDVCSSDLEGAEGAEPRIRAADNVCAGRSSTRAGAGTCGRLQGQGALRLRQGVRHSFPGLDLFGPFRSSTGGGGAVPDLGARIVAFAQHRSEEHTSDLHSLMRISYTLFSL